MAIVFPVEGRKGGKAEDKQQIKVGGLANGWEGVKEATKMRIGGFKQEGMRKECGEQDTEGNEVPLARP